MQKQATTQSPVSSGGDAFDMWHDYMQLGRLLCGLQDVDSGDPGRAKEKDPEDAPLTRVQTPPRCNRGKKSAGSSSASSQSSDGSGGTCGDCCRFCKQNGESAAVYRSHRLKSDTGTVTCPILRKYTCPTCGASGDYAHTRRYCPEAARMAPASKFW
ncbi:unnamed protein product [Ophioblennius macclurei]